jgi:hypothetical protein
MTSFKFYKDRTFCTMACGNLKCEKNYTREHANLAQYQGVPVCFGELKSETCGYLPVSTMGDAVGGAKLHETNVARTIFNVAHKRFHDTINDVEDHVDKMMEEMGIAGEDDTFIFDTLIDEDGTFEEVVEAYRDYKD